MSLMDGLDVVGYVTGAVLLVIAGLAQWRGKLRLDRTQIWFAVFIVVLLVMARAMPGGDNRLLAFSGLWSMWVVGQIRWKGWATRLVCWALRVFALFVIADALWHLGRPGWINPNISGAILVLGLTFIGSKQWAGVWVLALICTGSRGAILSVALPLAWWNRAFILRHKWTALAVAAVGVVLVAARPDTLMARLDHWAEALRLFAASPIVGWGPGNYINVSAIPWQNHADNALLTLLAEQGMVGVLALAPLAVAVVLQWRRSGSQLARLVLLACLLHNLVDDTWLQPWLALLIGLNLVSLWRTDEVSEGTLAGVNPADVRAAAPAPTVGATVE